jgi:outer membrane lipoprotein SlyB
VHSYLLADSSGTATASIITAVTGLLVGAGALTRSVLTDRRTTDIDTRKLDGETFDRITREQREMLDDLRVQNEVLRKQNVRQQAQIDDLRVKVAECDADKDVLRRQLQEALKR